MSNQNMWEARYRDKVGHTPDGVSPHPMVLEEAQAMLERKRHNDGVSEPLNALDLGSGAGRHALALAGLGVTVTAVDFAASAQELVQRDAAAQGLADRIRLVVADVSSWHPTDREVFDILVASYLHIDLSVLVNSADLLAPGGRLVWIAHAPDSSHGPPPEVVRDTLADFRTRLASLNPDDFRVLRLEEYQLSSEFLDIIVILERLPVGQAHTAC